MKLDVPFIYFNSFLLQKLSGFNKAQGILKSNKQFPQLTPTEAEKITVQQELVAVGLPGGPPLEGGCRRCWRRPAAGGPWVH